LESARLIKPLWRRDFYLLNRINSIATDPISSKSFELFEKSGFKILQIHEPKENSIDFLVDPNEKELRRLYGLREAILVRHIFTEPKATELNNLDSKLNGLVRKERAEPGVAFMIVKTSKSLEGHLARRLETGGESGQLTTIIPIEHKILKYTYSIKKKFRSILNQWLFKRDLYQDHFPVSGRYFFGRENQLKSLFASVDEGHHVGIFGLRKAGKTSFLWRVRDRSDTDIVAYVDLLEIPAAVKNCDYVYWLLGNEFAKDIKNKYPEIAKYLNFDMFGIYDKIDTLMDKPISLLFDSDIKTLRRAITKQNLDSSPKIIILLDEIERLLPSSSSLKPFEGYIDFFSYWRGQAQHHRDIVTVITGANPAITEQSQWEKIDNPVYQFYKEEFIPPMNYHECSTMLNELGAGMGVSYTPRVLKRIYELTGGHPFIARRFCSRLCQRNLKRPLRVNSQIVENTIPSFMRYDSKLFEEILDRLARDFPEELEIIELMAKRGKLEERDIKDRVGRHYRTIINHLIGYQLIVEEEEGFKIGLTLLLRYML